MRLWALDRSLRSQALRPFWGSALLGEEVVRRFNSQRPSFVEFAQAGVLSIQTTGSGRAFAGGFATAASVAPRGVTVEVTTLEGASTRRVPRGRAVRLRVTVSRQEAWVLGIELPSGVVVEGTEGWTAKTDPPILESDRIVRDPPGRITAVGAGPRTVELILRGVWPGTYVGPYVRAANPRRLDEDGFIDAGPLEVTP